MKSNNGNPQDPRNFLEELQRNTVEALERVSSEQDNSAQQATSAPEPPPLSAIITLAQFGHRAQMLVFAMDHDLREARLESRELGEENKQMSLKIEALNETIAARDARIEELTANIERLTKEKAKLRVA